MSLFSSEITVENLPLQVDGSAVTQPVSAAALPLPAGASTEATLALIKAKTDNLDVLLSTRTKPSDTQIISGAVTVSGSVSVGNFPATQPVSGTVSIGNFPATQPVSIAGSVAVTGPLTDTQLRASPVPVTSTPVTSSTANITRVATSNSSVLLLASNPNRKGLIITTETGAANYVAFGATASLTSYTYLMGSQTTLEKSGYTGPVSLIRASGSGNVQVTELV